MRTSKYTRELLAPIVAESSSVADVLRKLGLQPTGGNWRYIRGRLRHTELDTSHFGSTITRRISRLTSDELGPLVTAHLSFAQVAAALGLPVHGGTHRRLKARIEELALDTSHFLGGGWSRGKTRDTDPSIDRQARALMRPDEDVFIENAAPLHGPALVSRLLRTGLEYECATCGLREWRGRQLTLHLDHINGINNDNRRENLRLLCPNCHSQTDTYGRRPSRASDGVLYEWPLASVVKWQTRRL